MTTVYLVIALVVITWVAFALLLCRAISRSDVEREWFYEMRNDLPPDRK